MKRFPGAHRRIFIVLPSGYMAHLRKRKKASIGSETWCGRLGGQGVNWPEVKALDLCATCVERSGLRETIEASS